MLRRIIVPFLVSTVAAVSACTMRHSAVWVDAGAVEDFRFWVADSRERRGPIDNLQLIRIGECGAWPRVRMTWEAGGSLTATSDTALAITYGHPPAGFINRVGPEPLRPGCYVLEISGAGVSASTCFEVDSARRVTPLSGGTLKCEPRDRAT
jgi:hypothetical protein